MKSPERSGTASSQSEEFLEKERKFGFFVEKGKEEALDLVKKRFEDTSKEDDKLEFHKTSHTRDVIRRTRMILSVLERIGFASSHDVAIGELAGAFHDVVQNWEENRMNDGNAAKIMRKRFVGANERQSADDAEAFMRKANQESGQELFASRDIAAVREAIDGTIPGFDPQKKTVIQPNVNEHSSLIARAVALADLGAAGMDRPEVFTQEGDNLFREENLDIIRAFKNKEDIPDNNKESFRNRMLAWSRFQPDFARGRKELLGAELRGMPENAAEEVGNLFAGFDASIALAEEVANRRTMMPFEDLARDMGYQIS